MSENLKKFLELVSEDENMKQKVLACNDMEKGDAVRDCIALAKKVGIELTEADFANKEACSELTEDELEAVAGGEDGADDEYFLYNGDGPESCICMFVGWGKAPLPEL